MNIVRRTVIGAFVVGAMLTGGSAVAGVTTATNVGKDAHTKWHTDGFACAYNNDGSTACRFDVKVKNRGQGSRRFICRVRIRTENSLLKGFTNLERIEQGEWETLYTNATLAEGEIVVKFRARCWRAEPEETQ